MEKYAACWTLATRNTLESTSGEFRFRSFPNPVVAPISPPADERFPPRPLEKTTIHEGWESEFNFMIFNESFMPRPTTADTRVS